MLSPFSILQNPSALVTQNCPYILARSAVDSGPLCMLPPTPGMIFSLFCSSSSYHPSRTMPPLAISPYELDFYVCLSAALGLWTLQGKSFLLFIPGTPWSLPWCLVYSRCSKKGFLHEWTNVVLYQTELNRIQQLTFKNVNATDSPVWGKGWVFFEGLVTFTSARCAVILFTVVTYYKEKQFLMIQVFSYSWIIMSEN